MEEMLFLLQIDKISVIKQKMHFVLNPAYLFFFKALLSIQKNTYFYIAPGPGDLLIKPGLGPGVSLVNYINEFQVPKISAHKG